MNTKFLQAKRGKIIPLRPKWQSLTLQGMTVLLASSLLSLGENLELWRSLPAEVAKALLVQLSTNIAIAIGGSLLGGIMVYRGRTRLGDLG